MMTGMFIQPVIAHLGIMSVITLQLHSYMGKWLFVLIFFTGRKAETLEMDLVHNN